MLVRLCWADYDYTDSSRTGDRQDAYWVECSADEGLPLLAERSDEPRVPPETLGWGRTTPYPIDHQRFYFLITRDGASIVPRSAHYPTSSRWKGASPFRRVGPFEINDISELAGLPAPSRESTPPAGSHRPCGAISVLAVALDRLRRR
ncbi:MAG: hypothetical protein JWN81_1314 [Solirubrobacterales bacterium]|jgi:hypothetical protein|nr:hypothetical protein [Solirubrobacterales bacterium]